MTKAEMIQYVKNSFLPIQLVTSDTAIQQACEEAVRWFDREGADIVFQQFAYNSAQYITLPPAVDVVMNVYLNQVVSELFTAQTLLLGVTILDYDIKTLALKMDHLSNLRTFLASKFRWRWIKPNLYVDGMMTGVTKLVVQYLKHYDYTAVDPGLDGSPLDWVLRYSIGVVKQREGRILRMGSVIRAPLDGSELVSEGKAEVEGVKDELRRVRAVVPISRSV